MPAANSIRVLIVDDQLTMRSLMRSALQTLGFNDFADAADGEEALKSLAVRPAFPKDVCAPRSLSTSTPSPR